MSFLLRSLPLCAGFTLLAAPLASSAETLKTHTTKGWTAKVPSSWRQTSVTPLGKDPRFGGWVLRSPNGNTVLRVRLQPEDAKPLPFGKEVAASSKRFLDLVTNVRPLDSSITKDAGRDIAYTVLRATMKRNKRQHRYTVARIVMRYNTRKTLVTMTLMATPERMSDFTKHLESITKSFDLAAPAPVKR